QALILLSQKATMRFFMILVLLVAVVAIGISFYDTYDSGISPAASVADSKAAPTAPAEARTFTLMPDGMVEVTDTLARRVFRWDGTRWLEHESTGPSLAKTEAR